MRTLRVLVFADGANVLGSARIYNRRVDWSKLRDYLANPEERRELVEMAVYEGMPPMMEEYQEARLRKQKFLHWLRSNGFMVVTKDGSPTEEGRYKSNVDVLMAIDALDMAVSIRPDVVVLVTGDSDFAHLANTLRRRGIRVEVASALPALSNVLKGAANSIIDLEPVINEFPPLNGADAGAIGTDSVFD